MIFVPLSTWMPTYHLVSENLLVGAELKISENLKKNRNQIRKKLFYENRRSKYELRQLICFPMRILCNCIIFLFQIVHISLQQQP